MFRIQGRCEQIENACMIGRLSECLRGKLTCISISVHFLWYAVDSENISSLARKRGRLRKAGEG